MTGEASDPVSAYVQRALRESEAFLVDAEDGSNVGVVDKLLLDESGRVAGIEVCVGWFGRRRWTFSAADVVAVWPGSRHLFVSDASVADKRPAAD